MVTLDIEERAGVQREIHGYDGSVTDMFGGHQAKVSNGKRFKIFVVPGSLFVLFPTLWPRGFFLHHALVKTVPRALEPHM
jgi:hypothetical protein